MNAPNARQTALISSRAHLASWPRRRPACWRLIGSWCLVDWTPRWSWSTKMDRAPTGSRSRSGITTCPSSPWRSVPTAAIPGNRRRAPTTISSRRRAGSARIAWMCASPRPPARASWSTMFKSHLRHPPLLPPTFELLERGLR